MKKHKSEHNGAKHAKGYWGRKREAKQISNKVRRTNDRAEIHDGRGR
jgi:hypothetical protein